MSTRRAAFGAAALLLGLLLWGAAVVLHGSQKQSFARGAVPPDFSSVTEGVEYLVSVPGGVRTLSGMGLDPASLSCEYVTPSGQRAGVALTPEASDTKAVNTIGSIVAPVGGRIGVDCTGYGRVFLDGADDASTDWSGVALVAAMALLTVGAGLVLSVVRDPGSGRGVSHAMLQGGASLK